LRKIQCSYCGKEFWTKIKKMYVVWLCNVTEVETTNPAQVSVIHEPEKIKTCGAFPTRAEADACVIPEMTADQCKAVERIDTIREQFCAKCRHDAKVSYDRLKARSQKEAKMRMKNRGVESSGEAINPIPDKDFKAYLRYLVDSKVKQDYQQKEQATQKAAEEEKKAEDLKKREAEAMAKRERLIGGGTVNGDADKK